MHSNASFFLFHVSCESTLISSWPRPALLTYDADLGGSGELPDPSSEAATAGQPAQVQYQVMLEVRRLMRKQVFTHSHV